MPKRAVFIEDYGRSSKYAITRRNREFPDLSQVTVDDQDELDSQSSLQNDLSSGDSEIAQNENVREADLNALNPPQPEIPIDDNENRGDEELRREDDIEVDANIDSEDGDEFFIGDENSDSEFSDEEHANDGNQPLYAGAPITLSESMISILMFVLCYNLTGTALDGLLGLLSLHCVRPNQLKKSIYSFRKYFRKVQYPLIKHYYCSACLTSLPSSISVCEVCDEPAGVSYFIEIPIVEQLQVLFQRPGFYESLQYRFQRQKKNIDCLEDIYDGKVYSELGEILSDPDNISFQWNVDGVSIFKSSGFQIWPFYISINELPFAERLKPDNIILAGLWFGPYKPAPNLFLEPFVEKFRDLYNGVFLQIHGREELVKIRGIIISGTCDLPAKALFLNMTQFNGKYGCPKCKLRGRSENGVWTYPFQRNLNLRTDEETIGFAEEALENNCPVYGIKGPSILSLFVWQFIRTTAVDSMHCVFAGVVKKMCSIFFDPSFSDHEASLYRFLDLVDSRLSALSPPSFLQRRPRSIKKHLKYWKANELKAWFFYYSLPILYDIMPEKYFEHYSMFVMAIYILHQNSISNGMIDKASELLVEFVNRFDVLYGDRFMSCNLHQLLHLSDTVRDFGPLWTTTCFPFEDLNGKLKRLVHSSNHPELQICSTISTFVNLTSLRYKTLAYGSPAWEYCYKLSRPTKKRRLRTVTEEISTVGKGVKTLILSAMVEEAFAHAGILGTRYETFSRLMKDNVLYTAESYTRRIRYNNTCVLFAHDDSVLIGITDSFIKVHNCACEPQNVCECNTEMYAVVRECTLSSFLSEYVRRNAPKFMFECSHVERQAVAINVQQLLSVCFVSKINDQDKIYVALPANTVEIE